MGYGPEEKRGSAMLVESCLTCLVAFCDETTGLVDQGRGLDGFYLNFNKAFDTVIMLSDKLTKYRLDKWTVVDLKLTEMPCSESCDRSH